MRARRKRPPSQPATALKGSELNPDSFLHFCLKLPRKREGERALFVAHANFSWCEAKIEGRRLTSGAHPESPSDTRNFAVQPPFQMRESECEASNSSTLHGGKLVKQQNNCNAEETASNASSLFGIFRQLPRRPPIEMEDYDACNAISGFDPPRKMR